MDQETQTYYDNYFNLFLTDGWKQLMQDFGNNAVQINSVEAVKMLTICTSVRDN